MQRELADVIAKGLFIIYHCSWSIREVTEDWGLASVTPIYRKAGMEDAWNYCQPDLGARDGYGADCLEGDDAACAGQLGDQA